MLDTICSPVERNDILYQWKTDEHLLRRNTFIGDCYNEFQERKDAPTLLRVMMANYILEGIYFYSGFMFFYNLSRNGKMSGSAQEIRYINRDENTHLWLFRNIITDVYKRQNQKYRSIGLGVSGYHHMLAKRGIRWESEEHLAFTDAVFEHINYAAVKADTALACLLYTSGHSKARALQAAIEGPVTQA